ncbi:MAG: SH3 domain-containing protein [Epulopiscium sp.]|nr:SH3 domain-containing protein [Candidatus Epulonipiscium sp.]
MARKKIKKIIGAATLGVLIFSQALYANAYGNVNATSLNIRAGASANHKVIDSAGNNEYIHILDKVDGGWYAIETKTKGLGYVSGQYIDMQKARGIVNANNVNIRSGADYSAPVISKVHKNNVLYAHEQVGDWLLVYVGNQEGYIHREFLDGIFIDQLTNKKAAATPQNKPAEKTIAVPTTNVNLREQATTDSTVLRTVSPTTVVTVLSIGEDWVHVVTSDNIEGYMAKSYLNIGKESAKDKLVGGNSQTNTPKPSNPSSNKGEEVVAYAMQFLGNPYVYGGNSLTTGVDCSGFTSQVYKNFGVSLSRSSSAQYANNGTHVSSSDVRPGDLMFYGYNGNVSHVAIYIGNGQVIQASTPKTGITTGTAFRTSGKPLIGIKRVI